MTCPKVETHLYNSGNGNCKVLRMIRQLLAHRKAEKRLYEIGNRHCNCKGSKQGRWNMASKKVRARLYNIGNENCKVLRKSKGTWRVGRPRHTYMRLKNGIGVFSSFFILFFFFSNTPFFDWGLGVFSSFFILSYFLFRDFASKIAPVWGKDSSTMILERNGIFVRYGGCNG